MDLNGPRRPSAREPWLWLLGGVGLAVLVVCGGVAVKIILSLGPPNTGPSRPPPSTRPSSAAKSWSPGTENRVQGVGRCSPSDLP